MHEGSTTDGPSEPQIVDALISPFGFGIWGPSIFHDAGFRCTLLRWQVMDNGPHVLDERYGDMAGQRGEFIPAEHNAKMIDDLFNDFMAIAGCHPPSASPFTTRWCSPGSARLRVTWRCRCRQPISL